MGRRADGLNVQTLGELRASDCGRSAPASLTSFMRALSVPQTGKQGTTVAVLTRYGQVMRQYIKPKGSVW